MSGSEPVEDRRVMSGEAVADFSHLTSPEELDAIARIEGVATVIVPRSLAGAYARIPTSDVASTVFVPDGANIRVHTGSLTVSKDTAVAGDADRLGSQGVAHGGHSKHPAAPSGCAARRAVRISTRAAVPRGDGRDVSRHGRVTEHDKDHV